MTVFQVHEIVFTLLHFVHCVYTDWALGTLVLMYTFETGLHFFKFFLDNMALIITELSDVFEHVVE